MIVLSIALSSYRLHLIKEVVDRVLKGSQLPDEIWINYSFDPHYLDKGLSHPPLINIQDLKETMEIVYNLMPNYGPVRIYYPVISKFWENPETIIILLDDDLGVSEHTVEDLLYYREKLDCCVTTAGHIIGRGKYLFKKTVFSQQILEPEKVHIPFVGWGTTFKIKDIHETILKWDNWKENYYSNEPFLAYCLALQGTDRYVIPADSIKIFPSGYNLHENRKNKEIKNKLLREFYQTITVDNAELTNEIIYEI